MNTDALRSSHTEILIQLVDHANGILLGKEHELKLALCCILARGHLLIEDQPGMGKTTLAKTLAKLLGLKLSRIQFTSDLLPADVLGVSVFDDEKKEFVFHPGPIFSQFILGDELNRASPKTQSAFLQAMEEAQVTVDTRTYDLPRPFLLMATQNPKQSAGTFALPESQLDRFLMKISLGFPSEAAEKELLLSKQHTHHRAENIKRLPEVLNPELLMQIQNEVDEVKTREPVVQYILNLVRESRRAHSGMSIKGLSPRVGIDLVHAAKAWAYLSGRDFVTPEDVQTIFVPVTQHRFEYEEDHGKSIAQGLVERVPVL